MKIIWNKFTPISNFFFFYLLPVQHMFVYAFSLYALIEVTSLNWILHSHSFLVMVRVCTFLTVRSSDFTQTEHIYMDRTHLHRQNTFTQTVHIYTGSTHLHGQYTFTRAVHIYTDGTHLHRRYTFTQTVHIYTDGTHLHRQYTFTQTVHIYTDITNLRTLNTPFKDVKLRRVSLTIHLPVLHIWALKCIVCNVSHLSASRKHWQLQWRFERMYRTRSNNVEMFQYVKVNCTLVQAPRLSTGRTAHRGSRDIALLFHWPRH
jgi:hypothetical protein